MNDLEISMNERALNVFVVYLKLCKARDSTDAVDGRNSGYCTFLEYNSNTTVPTYNLRIKALRTPYTTNIQPN